jgi:hypothetical protein
MINKNRSLNKQIGCLVVGALVFQIGNAITVIPQTGSQSTQSKSGKELLVNGAFTSGISNWKIEESGAKGETTVGIGGPSGKPALRLKVIEVGDKSWRLQMHQGPLMIMKGHKYMFEFWCKSDRESTMTVNCMQNHEPWEHHGAAAEMKIDKSWKKLSFPFTGPWEDANARITITNLGTVVGQTYWFASCSLKEVHK